MARVAWRLSITAKQIKQKPKIGASIMCRLAVESLPPGGSSSRTQNQHRKDESHGHHWPGDFWKNPRNTNFIQLLTDYMHPFTI